MSRLKILVACHKPGVFYQDEVYTPIHVGRVLSKYKEEMAGMIGDDTGDNISNKNPQYCELTAQYWAWKNLHDVDFIGFCHYRRFFNVEISADHVAKLLNRHDVIALKIIYPFSMAWEIQRYISMEHFVMMQMVIKKKYPEYEQTLLDYLRGNILYAKNMFICRKELFDQYAAWLFDILFECEKYMKPMPYARLERSLAYMGEYLMPVYMMHHHKRMVFADCYESPSIVKRSWKWRLYHYFWDTVYNVVHAMSLSVIKKNKALEDSYLESVLVGFKQDGIKI